MEAFSGVPRRQVSPGQRHPLLQHSVWKAQKNLRATCTNTSLHSGNVGSPLPLGTKTPSSYNMSLLSYPNHMFKWPAISSVGLNGCLQKSRTICKYLSLEPPNLRLSTHVFFVPADPLVKKLSADHLPSFAPLEASWQSGKLYAVPQSLPKALRVKRGGSSSSPSSCPSGHRAYKDAPNR